MTHDAAFLDAICTHPEDCAIRLIYADWLEENGKSEQAEFIRLQMELAQMGDDDPRRPKLRVRERELLKLFWSNPFHDSVMAYEFQRGFVECVTMTAAKFLAHGDVLFQMAPVRHVIIMRIGDLLPRLASSPLLANLTSLNLSSGGFGNVGAQALATSPFMVNLTSLNLRENLIEDEGVKALASSLLLANLTSLDLSVNLIGAVGAQALACSLGLVKLRSLDLSYNGISDVGAQALASSPHLANLTLLNLSSNAIGQEGAQALASSPYLAKLTSLNLQNNRVDHVAV